jgi:cutinase
LSIREGVRLFQLAQSKCPGTPVVAGGYSQGAALIAAAVSDLSGATQEQVKGVTLFGYTKNQQNGGRIPNYPTDRTKVFCALGDLVCEGTLIVVAPHLTYNDDARGPGAEFLASKI